MKLMKWKEMSRKRKRILILGVANLFITGIAVLLSFRMRVRPDVVDTWLVMFVSLLVCIGFVNLKYLLWFDDGPDSKK